jgi:hypothetical protein
LSAKDAKNAKRAKKKRVGVLLVSLSFAFFASFADKKPARMVAASSMREQAYRQGRSGLPQTKPRR